MSSTHHRDTIVSLMAALAREKPDLPLYTFLDAAGGEAAILTCREVMDAAQRAACRLRARLTEGEPVMVLSPCGPDTITMLLGAMLAGCRPVPVTFHPRLGMISIVKLIARTGVRVVLGRRATLAKLKSGRARSEPVFRAKQHDLVYLAIDDGEIADQPLPDVASTDVALIYPGLSGDENVTPVPLSHGALLNSVDHLMQALLPAGPCPGTGAAADTATRVARQDSLMTCLDPADGLTLILHILLPLRGRFASVLFPVEQALRDAGAWLRAVSAYQSSMVSAPMAVLSLAGHQRAAGKDGQADLSGLRFLCVSAEHTVPATLSRFIERYRHNGMSVDKVFACYGMSAAGRYLAGRRGFRTSLQNGVNRLALGVPVSADVQAMIQDRCLLPENGELFCKGRPGNRFAVDGTVFQAEDIESVILQSFGVRGLGHCVVLHMDSSQQTVVLAECATRQLAEKWQGVVPAIMQRVLADTGCRLNRVLLLRPGSLPLSVSGIVLRQRCATALDDGTLMLRLLPVRGK